MSPLKSKKFFNLKENTGWVNNFNASEGFIHTTSDVSFEIRGTPSA